jgi:hypothetical protein
MFNFFKDKLENQDPPTISIIFFVAASNYLKKSLKKEGEKSGSPDITVNTDGKVYLDINEIYYGYLFGRVIARIDGGQQEISPPPSPIGRSEDMSAALITTIIPANEAVRANKSGPGFDLTVRHPDSVSRKALVAAEAWKTGKGYIVSEPFKLHFESCLVNMGLPEGSASTLSKKFGDEIDEVIEGVCNNAKELWNEIPWSKLEEAEERFATMSQALVSKINSRKSFGPHFQKADAD